jgi:hypothetical protein
MIARIKTNLIKYFFFGNSITEVVLEMHQRIDGTWIETDEDIELQARFSGLRASVPKWQVQPSVRIGADFLRRYQHLL